MLQDRPGGPAWLVLKPILGVMSIEGLAIQQAGLKPVNGKEPTFDNVRDAAKNAACEAVLKAVTADDVSGTVTVRLLTATPWFLQLAGWAVLDREWMVSQGDWDGKCDNWTRWHAPDAEKSVLFDKANGTGPYRLAQWKKGDAVYLEANDNYWRTEAAWPGAPVGPARIKHVVMAKVPEWGTRFVKLEAGEADIVDVPPPNIDQVADLVQTEYNGIDETAPAKAVHPDGILKLFKGYPLFQGGGLQLIFKVSTEGGNEFIGSGKLDGNGVPPDFLSDIHVRRGFNYCFDWDTFIRDAYRGEAVKMRGPIIAGLQGYRDDSPVYSLDLDKCKTELAQAWGGKLPETGFRLTGAYSGSPGDVQTLLEILADNLARVNPKYRLETVNLEWPTLLDNLNRRRLPISGAGWGEDYHDASNWVQPFMASTGFFASNQGFPADLTKQIDALVDRGMVSTDPTERDAIYAQLQQIAYDNAIDIFGTQLMGRTYLRREITGWYSSSHYDFYQLSKSGP